MQLLQKIQNVDYSLKKHIFKIPALYQIVLLKAGSVFLPYLCKFAAVAPCGPKPLRMTTPAEHLKLWFTPIRRELISARKLDKLAGRPLGTFSRFLAGQRYFTFTRASLEPYYPFLREVGYKPPGDPPS